MPNDSSPLPFSDWPSEVVDAWRAHAPANPLCRSVFGRFLRHRLDAEGASAPLADLPGSAIVASFVEGLDKRRRSALRQALEAAFPGSCWDWMRRRQRPVTWPSALLRAFEHLGLEGLPRHAMSRLLRFRAELGESETLSLRPGAETVKNFVAQLEEAIPSSAGAYRLALREALAGLFPEGDWEWMRRLQLRGVPFANWPPRLRQAWVASGLASRSIRASFGRLLAHYDIINIDREMKPTRDVIDGYVERLKASTSLQPEQHDINDLFYALGAVYPPLEQWRWVKRVYRQPPKRRAEIPRSRKYSLNDDEWPPEYLERMNAAEAAKFADLDIERLFDVDSDDVIPLESLPKRTRNLWRRRRKIVPGSAGKYWWPATRRNVRETFALFLGAARKAGLPLRLTPEAIRAFVNQCETRGCSLSTIQTRVMRLFMAAHVVEPNGDWSWIAEIARAMAELLRAWELDPEMVGKTSRRKVGLVVNAGELWLLGEQLMNEARAETEDDLRAALLFRDGLMLCILASAPVRVGAFAKTTIDGHLTLEDDGIVIHYAWTETKQKREEVRYLPLELAAAIRDWMKEYRSRLVRDESEKALWLSLSGTPLTSQAISTAIADLTEHEPNIGVRITAHRIRDCVVSTIAERAPAQVHISCEILQHSHDGTVRIYDQHASQIEAVRQARASCETYLDEIRRKLRQEGDPEALRSRPLSYLHARPKRRRRRRAELPNAA
jgi:hypothetical protein